MQDEAPIGPFNIGTAPSGTMMYKLGGLLCATLASEDVEARHTSYGGTGRSLSQWCKGGSLTSVSAG